MVPLSHCGIHWVRADASLAAALARAPLLIRVFRVYGKTTGLLAAKPQTKGDEAAHSEAWLSCTLVGECSIDFSSMISSSAIRKHQPDTRWLSGTLSLIEPEAKLFVNNRVQVRALMELLPSTLPPLTWLSKSAWQPMMAPNPASLSRMLDDQSSINQPPPETREDVNSSQSKQLIEAAAETEEEVINIEAPIDPAAESHPMKENKTVVPFTSLSSDEPNRPPVSALDTSSFNLNDYLFSFANGDDEVPGDIADEMLNPSCVEPQAADDLDASVVDDLLLACSSLAPGSPSHLEQIAKASTDQADMDADKEMLRRQLQELELISLGFMSRFESTALDYPQIDYPQIDAEVECSQPLISKELAHQSHPEEDCQVVYAPRVNKTCSEDGDDLFLPGLGTFDTGSMDSDDTDELLARASGLEVMGPKIEHVVNAPTLFSSALDPDLIFSFSRPTRPSAAHSSPSALSSHPVPQFMQWKGPKSAAAPPPEALPAPASPRPAAASQDLEIDPQDLSFSPSRINYEGPPSQSPYRFVFSNSLPSIQPDFKLDYSA